MSIWWRRNQGGLIAAKRLLIEESAGEGDKGRRDGEEEREARENKISGGMPEEKGGRERRG